MGAIKKMMVEIQAAVTTSGNLEGAISSAKNTNSNYLASHLD